MDQDSICTISALEIPLAFTFLTFFYAFLVSIFSLHTFCLFPTATFPPFFPAAFKTSHEVRFVCLLILFCLLAPRPSGLRATVQRGLEAAPAPLFPNSPFHRCWSKVSHVLTFVSPCFHSLAFPRFLFHFHFL